MNNNSNSIVALTLLFLAALSSVAQAQEFPQIGPLGADMQGAGAPKAKPIFPKNVIQVGKRTRAFIYDVDGDKAFSPWNGDVTVENQYGQLRNLWGFRMVTDLRVMDDQKPPEPYTKGRIGEQLTDPITYGVVDANGRGFDQDLSAQGLRRLEEGIRKAGHGGNFVDVNGWAVDTSTVGNPNNPNEKWFSLIQGFVIIDTKSRGNIPDPAVRDQFSQQTVGLNSYRGYRIPKSHALAYFRSYYERKIDGNNTP